MIYFIKKFKEDNSCEVHVQSFESEEKCKDAINSNDFIVPDIVVSDTIKVLDFKFKNSIAIIVDEQYAKPMADVIARGLNTLNKSDDFIIQTIARIHEDKIKYSLLSLCDSSINASDLESTINQCRDKCIDFIRHGISVEKKVISEFLSLKCDLGIVGKPTANN